MRPIQRSLTTFATIVASLAFAGSALAQTGSDSYVDQNPTPRLVTAPPIGGPGCPSTIAIRGTPRINTTVQFVLNGTAGCHACVWVSKNAGPSQVGNIRIPIGFPLLDFFSLGAFPPSGTIAFPVAIPNDPNLVGLTLYFTTVSHPPNNTSNLDFAPQVAVTIQP